MTQPEPSERNTFAYTLDISDYEELKLPFSARASHEDLTAWGMSSETEHSHAQPLGLSEYRFQTTDSSREAISSQPESSYVKTPKWDSETVRTVLSSTENEPSIREGQSKLPSVSEARFEEAINRIEASIDARKKHHEEPRNFIDKALSNVSFALGISVVNGVLAYAAWAGNYLQMFNLSEAPAFVKVLANNSGDYIWGTAGMVTFGNKWAKRLLGKYTPEVAAVGLATYLTLGESVFPKILPGSPDVWDIPAGLIGVGATYLMMRSLSASYGSDWRR